MHALKTVRVAHPTAPDTFQLINARDYREGVHGPLWPEQAPDFDADSVRAAPAQNTHRDPAVRDLAAALMSEFLDARFSDAGEALFSTLSPPQQIAALHKAQAELREAVAERRQWRAAAQTDQDAARTAQAEAARIEAERQAREDAAQKAAATPAPAAEVAGAVPDPRTSQQRQSETAPTPTPAASGAAPAWAAPTAPAATATQAPDASALRVEQGPGKKYFVMRGKDVVGTGHAKKGDAETEMAKLEAGK